MSKVEFAAGTREADAALCGAIWQGDGGLGILTKLVDECQGRFAGTVNERRAADIILATQRAAGLNNVHEEPFTYPGWRRGKPSTLAHADSGVPIPTFSLPGSPAGSVEADLIDLGTASDADMERLGDQLAAKIVIISAATAPRGKPMHRDEKVARAARKGAVGVLWMRDEPGQLGETGALFFHDCPKIPGVAVAREDGLRLSRWVSQGRTIRLKLHTFDESLELTSWNLLAELPGNEYPDEVVLVGAHYDGHDIAEGALDNGSGTAAVLAAAAGLATVRHVLKRTVRFIGFGVEELGLYGAEAYAKQHSTDVNLRFLFNLDSIALPGAAKGVQTQRRPELRPVLAAIGAAMGDPFPIDDHLGMYSDQFPFVLEGFPAGLLTSPDSPRGGGRGVGHTTADTLDKVNALSLKLSALFTARLALHVANVSDWPAQRWTSAQTKQQMEDAGVRPTMEMEGIWPWPDPKPVA